MEQHADGVLYRLNRLAERGFIAELGRYPDQYDVVRLRHPSGKLPDLEIWSSGMITGCDEIMPGEPERFGIVCETEKDTARFERFLGTLGPRRVGLQSRYVCEVLFDAQMWSIYLAAHMVLVMLLVLAAKWMQFI
jgi:hypothetical protein